MILRFLIISSILLFNCGAFCQENRTSFEIFLLSDFSRQAYREPFITNINSTIEKFTVYNRTDITYGVGSQVIYDLNSYLSIQFGLGFKYTSLEFWFSWLESSDSNWSFFAVEDATLIHLFTPLSLYLQPLRNRRFRIRPGISIEPNLQIFQKSKLIAYDNDALSWVYEPEGSANVLFGLFSADLKCSYEFKNSSEVFTTIKLHNIPKYFDEDFGITASDIGLMINIGYKFKSSKK